MFIYNFDTANKKITEYDDENGSYSQSIELSQPLLDFINFDFSQYDLLRNEILLFIQKFEKRFNCDEIETGRILANIKKFFPNLHIYDIDGGDVVWWKAELIFHLTLQYNRFFAPCDYSEYTIQDNNDFDYLSLQKEIISIVEKIFDIDYGDFITGFTPLCRMNHYYNRPLHFNEKAVILPSEKEKFTDCYDLFAIPFIAPDEKDETSMAEYNLKEPQRQKYTKNNLNVLNGYEFMTLREAFDCEIFKMAQTGIYLKRCEYCGKYFIFNPNKPARYCNIKLSNVNMTCQQVASQEKYNKNISPIQKAYTNALKSRNKFIPSKKSGLRTPEQSLEYERWKTKNSKIKKEYQQKYDNAKTPAQREKIVEAFKSKLGS